MLVPTCSKHSYHHNQQNWIILQANSSTTISNCNALSQTETVKNNKPYWFRTRGVTQTGQWSPKSVQPCKSLEAMEELWSSTLEARFRALVDKSLSSSSMTTEEVSRLKSMESSIASTNIQTSQLPDFCRSCRCHMRLANACRFSFFFPWGRLDGTELEFILHMGFSFPLRENQTLVFRFLSSTIPSLLKLLMICWSVSDPLLSLKQFLLLQKKLRLK